MVDLNQFWSETFVQVDNLLETLHSLAVSVSSGEDVPSVELGVLQGEVDPQVRLSQSVSSLSDVTSFLFLKLVRPTRRAKTTAPDRSLRIGYKPVPELPSASVWTPLLESNENLLIKAYQKLVTYNPPLKDKIEPCLEASQKLRGSYYPQTNILDVLTQQSKLIHEVIDHAYSLAEITNELQQIQSNQINLIKESQESLTLAKSLFTEERRRINRKRTYVNVIYAEASSDNLPIQTALKLIEDIKSNQGQLNNIEEQRNEILKNQEKAAKVLDSLEHSLRDHEFWSSLAVPINKEPLLALYEKVILMLEKIGLSGGSNHSGGENIFSNKIEEIIDSVPLLSQFMPAEVYEEISKESQDLSSITDETVRLNSSLELILQCFRVFQRSERRSRTSGPSRGLRIKYNPLPERLSPNSIWMASLEQLDSLLVNSYHKLIAYNPNLRDKIEPSLISNKKVRDNLGRVDLDTICRMIEEEVLLMKDIVDSAYSLKEITKELQSIESLQINLTKESQEVYGKLKSVLEQQVERRAGKKRTYVNVIYAEPEEDNLPIQTILKLIDDIKRNQTGLSNLEAQKKACLDIQERPNNMIE